MYDRKLEDGFDVPAFAFHQPYPLDFFMLRDVRGEGAVIGHYNGRDMTETIIDGDGNRYIYRGLADCRADGRPDPDRLKGGEYLVEPCLIYEAESISGQRHADIWRRVRALFRVELAIPAQIGPNGGRR
jgi:hypothetical protein